MSGRGASKNALQWAGLVVGALCVVSTSQVATADELFGFADRGSIDEAMASLNEKLSHDSALPDPCNLYILDDLRGNALFDDETFQSMHQALATNILGAGRVDDCAVMPHEIEQSQVVSFLDERRASGHGGLAVVLTYYKLSEGVTVFANLRDVGGSILSSSGRFDLPVVAGTNLEDSDHGVAGITEAPSSAAQLTNQTIDGNEARTERALSSGEDVAATDRSFAESSTSEATYRQELAEGVRVKRTSSSGFNLRRVQAGVPPSIKTVRIVDVDGRDTALITDLAESFLGSIAPSSENPIKKTAVNSPGRRGTLIAIGGQSQGDAESIDIQMADAKTAFEQILNHEADIVVVRQPISAIDATRFANVYGVNMRSRYAERVVAIGANATQSLDCGISYQHNDMVMSTEDDPASERVYIYVNPAIPGAVRDRFIDFALTGEGQTVVARHAVDLRLQVSDTGYAAWRYKAAGEQEAEIEDVLERFRRLIRTSQRVSSTFRFDFASADLVLDARSEQDLENLIDLIKTRNIDSRRILLFGFADSSGDASFNVGLSRSRADAVAIRLRLAGIPVPPRNVHGIGEDSPVACNVQLDGERDETGAQKNRRVEVWIES